MRIPVFSSIWQCVFYLLPCFVRCSQPSRSSRYRQLSGARLHTNTFLKNTSGQVELVAIKVRRYYLMSKYYRELLSQHSRTFLSGIFSALNGFVLGIVSGSVLIGEPGFSFWLAGCLVRQLGCLIGLPRVLVLAPRCFAPQPGCLIGLPRIPVLAPRRLVCQPRSPVLDPVFLVRQPRLLVGQPRLLVREPRVPVLDPRVPVREPRCLIRNPRVARFAICSIFWF